MKVFEFYDNRSLWGLNFRLRRLEAGLSQADISDELAARGYPSHQPKVSLWDTGKAVPDINLWPVLADILGCEQRDFLTPLAELRGKRANGLWRFNRNGCDHTVTVNLYENKRTF